MPSTIVRYKDLPIRIILSITGALIFTIYGEKESTLELLLLPEFYPAFVISLVIASVVIHYVYAANTLLNRSYDWQKVPLQRALLQLLVSLAIPALIAFGMAVAYFHYHNVDIRKTFYLTHEFPFIVLLLALLNAYYICYYFLVKWQRTHTAMVNLEKSSLAPTVAEKGDTFLVSRGNRNIPVLISDIACIYRTGDANYLLTHEGEKYFLSGTMDDAGQKLDRQFFRVNRQLIINRSVLVSYKNDSFGKIALQLSVEVPEPAIVSQKRAKGFREWVS